MNIAVVRCSDIRSEREKPEIEALCRALVSLGADVKTGRYIFSTPEGDSACALAGELMSFFCDGKTDIILDISGGDSAERLLPYLDFDRIASSMAVFWGYSDLTVIINAILTRSGKSSVLWQARNIIRDRSGEALRLFSDYLSGGMELFNYPTEKLRGTLPQSRIVGGNLRCFLKLAGTDYFPDTEGCIILAEGLGGESDVVKKNFLRLKNCGALDKASGLLLGTFTAVDRSGKRPELDEFVLSLTDLPAAKTQFLGHSPNSKATIIN